MAIWIIQPELSHQLRSLPWTSCQRSVCSKLWTVPACRSRCQLGYIQCIAVSYWHACNDIPVNISKRRQTLSFQRFVYSSQTLWSYFWFFHNVFLYSQGVQTRWDIFWHELSATFEECWDFVWVRQSRPRHNWAVGSYPQPFTIIFLALIMHSYPPTKHS